MFEGLDKMTLGNMKKLCQDEGIPGYSKLKKTQLLDHIKKHRLDIMVKSGIDQLLNIR